MVNLVVIAGELSVKKGCLIVSSDLFGFNAAQNFLPYDGDVHYYGSIIDDVHAVRYYDHLTADINWKHDEAIIYGKHITTARKVAFVADARFEYRYSGVSKQASDWTAPLLELKTVVEQKTGVIFNSCLLNLYHHGGEGMGWHSDDEASLGANTVIASLSFGAARKFAFRHKKTFETIALVLESNSLLLMKGATQTYWQHSLLKSSRVLTPRINLTFRTMKVV
jgi:alkylated DNA repair dioxygenase AlkB